MGLFLRAKYFFFLFDILKKRQVMVKVLNGFHYKELLMCYLDGFDIILKCYLLAIGFRFMNNSFYGISFSLKHFFFFFFL